MRRRVRSFSVSPSGGVRSFSVSPSGGMRREIVHGIGRRWRGIDGAQSIRRRRGGIRCRNELRCAHGRRRGLRCALKKWRCGRRLDRGNRFFRFFFRRDNLFACRFRVGIDFGLDVFVGIFCFFGAAHDTQGKNDKTLLQNRPTLWRRGHRRHRQSCGRQCGRCFRLAFLHVPTLATKSPNHAGAAERYQAFSSVSMTS